MISKSYPKDHHNPHVGPLLLDLTLLPLENTKDSGFSQEHRVAYCDVIDPFFKNALNALMLDQPFEFRQVPIGCRIRMLRKFEFQKKNAAFAQNFQFLSGILSAIFA